MTPDTMRPLTQSVEHPKQDECLKTYFIDLGFGWPGLPAGSTLVLGRLGEMRGDGLYVIRVDGEGHLRRVQFRVGEVWLWTDGAPEQTRQVFTTDEFEQTLRPFAARVVGRFVVDCSDLADDLLKAAKRRRH